VSAVDNTFSHVILVVEDFNDTRFMTKQWLEMRGYRVVEAINGWEAVEIALREDPDLILMDLNLPVLDGFSVTCLIREREELRDVPVIAITAYDSPDCRADAFDAGCNEYITKPFDFEELEKSIKRLITSSPKQASKVQ
jgi:two-component system, cell cycle response regulator DivK